MDWLMGVEQISAGNGPGFRNNASRRLSPNGDALKEDYFSRHRGRAAVGMRKAEWWSLGVACTGEKIPQKEFSFLFEGPTVRTFL
jgi:hypothetical protein